MRYRIAATITAGMIGLITAVSAPLISLAAVQNVSIEDDYFTPTTILVHLGDTVVWRDDGMDQHTVNADDGSFQSGPLSSQEIFWHTFDAPGTYPYYCWFHGGPGGEGMSGIVTVTPS